MALMLPGRHSWRWTYAVREHRPTPTLVLARQTDQVASYDGAVALAATIPRRRVSRTAGGTAFAARRGTRVRDPELRVEQANRRNE